MLFMAYTKKLVQHLYSKIYLNNISYKLLHFTLDPYLLMLSVKQGKIKYHFFLVFSMTQPRIETLSSGPLANTNHYFNYPYYYD